MERKSVSPLWLFSQYWLNELSTGEIGILAGVSQVTICNYMVRHGIKRRTRIEAVQLPSCREKIRRSFTPGLRAEISKRMSGRTVSEEQRKKLAKLRVGTHLSEETKKKISRSVRETYSKMKRKRKPKTEEQKLCIKIRGLGEYKQWKDSVLKRDVTSYPSIPKNVQVHHMRPFLMIIRENNVTTIEKARKCAELWDSGNGAVLTKGEHYVASLMERQRKISKGFIQILKTFIALNKDRATEITNDNKKEKAIKESTGTSNQ